MHADKSFKRRNSSSTAFTCSELNFRKSSSLVILPALSCNNNDTGNSEMRRHWRQAAPAAPGTRRRIGLQQTLLYGARLSMFCSQKKKCADFKFHNVPNNTNAVKELLPWMRSWDVGARKYKGGKRSRLTGYAVRMLFLICDAECRLLHSYATALAGQKRCRWQLGRSTAAALGASFV